MRFDTTDNRAYVRRLGYEGVTLAVLFLIWLTH